MKRYKYLRILMLAITLLSKDVSPFCAHLYNSNKETKLWQSTVSSDILQQPRRRKNRFIKNEFKLKCDVSQLPHDQFVEVILDNENNNNINNKPAFQSQSWQRNQQEMIQKIRNLASLLAIREKLCDNLLRDPTETEWITEILDTAPELLEMFSSTTSNESSFSVKLKRCITEGQEARSKFISSHIGLVIRTAKRFENRGLQMADMIQEGNLGLIEAMERFDPDKGYAFSTYATWWIRHKISRGIADTSRVIRLPVYVHDLLTNMEKVKKNMVDVLNREPTLAELAQEMKIPLAKLHMYIRSSKNVLSLEKPMGYNLSKTLDGPNRSLIDTVKSDAPSPEDYIEFDSLRNDIFAVINQLNTREQQVVILRYGLGDDGTPKSVNEVAKIMKISRDRLRNIEARALNKLRHPVRNYKLKGYVGK